MSHAYSLINFKRRETRRGELPSLGVSVVNESTITVRSDYRSIHDTLMTTPPFFEIAYTQVGPNCAINWSNNHKLLENIDFIEIACQHLREILLEQKWILKFFDVDLRSIDSRIFDCIETSLNMRNRKIQIEELSSSSCEANHFLDILLLVDPKILKKVVINCDIDSLEDFLLSKNWEHFEGLEVNFQVQKVTSGVLEAIKRVFNNSTVFRGIFVASNELDENLERGNYELYSGECLKIDITDSTSIFAHRQSKPSKKSQFTRSACTTEFKETPWAILRVLENRITMEMILEYLSFRDIVSLRKVSWGTRQCIDLLELNPEFTKISIERTSTPKTRICYSFKNQDDEICANYEQLDTIYAVYDPVISQRIYDTICNDLSQNLKFQKSCLEEFRLDFIYEMLTQQLNMAMHHNPERLIFQNFPDKHKQNFHEMARNLKNFRANRNHDSISDLLLQPLPFGYKLKTPMEFFLNSIFQHRTSLLTVKKLIVAPLNNVDLAASLKFFDSKFLETLEIRSMDVSNLKTDAGLDVLSNLEQWKAAKNLVMRDDWMISTEIRPDQFIHFSNVEIFVKNLLSDKIFEFKQALLKSQQLKKFKIEFENFSDENLDKMGPPFQRENDQMAEKRKIWYFRMTEQPEFALQVQYHVDKCVIFARVRIEMVPENAL